MIFDKIIDIRDTISHRNPLLTVEDLNENFIEMLQQAQKKSLVIFNQTEEEDNILLSNLLKKYSSKFVVLFLFEDIMRYCYSYLALIDQALFESKFKRT